jgi:uncharacterized repeat protein (TIGR03803 family)
MKRGIRIGLASGKICRLIAVVLLVLAGQVGRASGQTFTVLWQFGSLSNDVDGANPWAGLIQGTDGSFYGTTGGTNTHNCTVFKITSAGTLTPLWQFGTLSNFGNGILAFANLIQGSDGNFYGTTGGGGNTNCFSGCGTVFKITSAGTLTTLWQFGSLSNDADGESPEGALVQGSDGNFYGTTFGGGAHSRGTVFRISPSGYLTNLYSFGTVLNDGFNPLAGLVQGNDGNFYGMTYNGGNNRDGTVFKITSAGTLTTLWQFGSLPNDLDGKWPYGALVQGSDGNFYGTTTEGGTTTYNGNGDGTVFKISSAGTLTPLWQFGSLSSADSGFPADGGFPNGLVQGSDGNFYGTTYGYGCEVFQITPAGTLTVLWQFSSLSNFVDGGEPEAGLVQGSDGSFYGTTAFGGINDQGTIFKLTVPLNPPANQILGMQFSGPDIVLNIPSVAYETYQLQFTTDPASGIWSNVVSASVTNCIGGLLSVTNFGGALQPQGFYRFDITP